MIKNKVVDNNISYKYNYLYILIGKNWDKRGIDFGKFVYS